MSRPATRLLCLFLLLCPAAFAQKVIATVNIGYDPNGIAINPVTHKVYVANMCADSNCASSSVTVIDEATFTTATVVLPMMSRGGNSPMPMAVDTIRNKIYVVICPASSCFSAAVAVIDGSTLAINLVSVGDIPTAIAVDENTNKIYVANSCSGCGGGESATLTVIDGATLSTTTVPLQYNYYYVDAALAVNPVTNKIYVTNSCGANDGCFGVDGTVSVVDGATLAVTTVTVGRFPNAAAVNTHTNKIYVTNSLVWPQSMTVIDGSTLSTTTIPLPADTIDVAVNQTTNTIYLNLGFQLAVIDGRSLATQFYNYNQNYAASGLAVNSAMNKTYTVFPQSDLANAFDGNNTSMLNTGVGGGPIVVGVDETNNRVYVENECGNNSGFCFGVPATVSVIDATPPTAWQFVPLTPCRLVDTRGPDGQFGGPPIQGGSFRSFPLPQGSCGIPPAAAAYALNATVVPHGALGYLTIWPAGQPQPTVSTMNSPDGRIKANAAIVAGGTAEGVSVYASDTTDVILDINGYFVPLPNPDALAFYPLAPCRVIDTRGPGGPLGGPSLSGGTQRDFPVLQAANCNIPDTAQAYSLNFTVVPRHTLGYLSVWPTGAPRPVVSTLNDPTGTTVANAALVPAGSAGDISTYVTDDTDLIVDIDGYFAPPAQGGLSLYVPTVCRLYDSRNLHWPLHGERTIGVASAGCSIPTDANAYVLNATALPNGYLGYLTLWPDGQPQPGVSTLNAPDGAITSNMAIVPSANGSIDAYAPSQTHLILDSSGYFAP